MLKYVLVTNENLQFATNIQSRIFPKESAFLHYKYSIESNLEYIKYYLVYDNDNVVGITGLYSNEEISETNSIWLGWFGVLEDFRSNGYGKQIFLDTIDMANDLKNKYPIKYFRLYTSERDDAIALPLYNKVMDIKEYYNNPDDDNYDGTCLIFSKSLTDQPVPYWNNKFINLKGIISDQEKSMLEINN